MDKRERIAKRFLHVLLEETFRKDASPNWKQRYFKEDDSPSANVKKILDAPANELWSALGTVLSGEKKRELLFVVED